MSQSERPKAKNFEDIREVNQKYEDFKAWKTLLDAVDLKAAKLFS